MRLRGLPPHCRVEHCRGQANITPITQTHPDSPCECQKPNRRRCRAGISRWSEGSINRAGLVTNASGNVGQGVVGQRDLAVLRPVVMLRWDLARRAQCPSAEVPQNPFDNEFLFYNRDDPHGCPAPRTAHRVDCVDFLDKPRPGGLGHPGLFGVNSFKCSV